MKIYFIIITFLSATLSLSGQTIEDYPLFQKKLQEVGIDFYTPLEDRYKNFEPQANDYEKYDFRMISKKEKMEIRYSIKPYKDTDFMSQNPHLLTMRAVTSIATNDQDYIITALEMSAIDLENDFGADWGMTYFFTPKNDFANTPHGRLIALYKEGRGTVFVIYLFNNTKNEALDNRYYALRFLKEKTIIEPGKS